MGTSNFYNKNASSVFSLEIEDSWQWDQVFENVKHQLSEVLDYHCYKQKNAPVADKNLRTFQGRIIGNKSKHSYDPTNDIEIIVTISSIIRSGYYRGANLDWNIETEVVNKQPLPDEAIEWIEQAKEDLIIELEGFYKEISTPLGVTARFSNGNTMYHKKES